jgi:hypothetical protein
MLTRWRLCQWHVISGFFFNIMEAEDMKKVARFIETAW